MIARLLSALCATGLGLFAESAAQPPATPIRDPIGEGRELAERLRNSAPAENAEFDGVLEITSREGKVRTIPISSRLTVTKTNWQVTYRAGGSNREPAETLVILHTLGTTNRYTIQQGTNPPVPAPLLQPFAGSDFWAQDFGLEFLHWPGQRALRAEMSRSRPCRVLESTPSATAANGYGRVHSWIDVETGALLQAEAFDMAGKLLKKFKLGSFTKVQGEWQLRDMTIRTLRTGQETKLKFELNHPADNSDSPPPRSP